MAFIRQSSRFDGNVATTIKMNGKDITDVGRIVAEDLRVELEESEELLPHVLSYNPVTNEIFYQENQSSGGGGGSGVSYTAFQTLSATVDTKAATSDLVPLQTQITDLQTTVTDHTTQLTGKVSQSDFSALQGFVTGMSATVGNHTTALATKANQSDLQTTNQNVTQLQQNLSSLSTTVASKADQTSLTNLSGTVSSLSGTVTSLQTAINTSTNTQSIAALQTQADDLQSQINAVSTTVTSHDAILDTVATQTDTAALSQGLLDLTTELNTKVSQTTLDTTTSNLQSLINARVSSISSANSKIIVTAANPAQPVLTLNPDLTATTLQISRTNGIDNQNATITKIGSQNKVLDFYPYFSAKGQQSGSTLTSDYSLMVSDNGGSKNNNTTFFLGSWNNNGGMHIAANGDLYFHGQPYFTHQYVKKMVLRNVKVTLLSGGLDGTLTGGSAAPKHSLEAWIDSTTKKLYFGWNNVSPRVFSGWCRMEVGGVETTSTIISQSFSSTSLYPVTSAFTGTVGNMTNYTACLYTDNGTEAYEIKATVLNPSSTTIPDFISIEKLI